MKKFSLLFVCVFLIAGNCLALDWKPLHEKADTQNLDMAKAAVQLKPDSIESLYILGLVYLNLHEDYRAEVIFKKILEVNPNTIEAKWGLAESLRREHKLDVSERMLNEVINSDPKFYPAYISLAYIRYIHMDFQGAVKLALKVMQQGRDNVDLSNYTRAYTMYAGSSGMIAHYGGPISKAINGLAVKPNLDKAELLQPNSPAVLFGLGSYYLLAPRIVGGDKVKAEKYLKRAISVDPKLAGAYLRLAQLYKIKGNIKQYDVYLKKALEADPKDEFVVDNISGKCKFICVGGAE